MKLEKQLLIKAALVIFLAGYIAFLTLSDSAKNISMDQISSAMEQQESITSLEKKGRTDLKRLYQIEEKDTQGYFFYKAASPMAVEEALILKAENKNQAEDYLQSANAHLTSQKQVFEGYGTDQMALLNQALVGRRGNYVYYFCGPDAASWRERFLSLI